MLSFLDTTEVSLTHGFGFTSGRSRRSVWHPLVTCCCTVVPSFFSLYRSDGWTFSHLLFNSKRIAYAVFLFLKACKTLSLRSHLSLWFQTILAHCLFVCYPADEGQTDIRAPQITIWCSVATANCPSLRKPHRQRTLTPDGLVWGREGCTRQSKYPSSDLRQVLRYLCRSSTYGLRGHA